MPKNAIRIYTAKHNMPIWEQRLRVAAYCRVSTKHEEQRRSLETQIAYYSNYIRNNPNWELVEEAEIVRKIFDLYIQGNGVRKIKRYLEEHGIKTVTGKAEWSTSTIDRIPSNEKYIGEVLMQKTYTSDFLTGKREKNRGQLDSYQVENAHEPIIGREIFTLVQKLKGQKKSK